jgi:predicted GTPase
MTVRCIVMGAAGRDFHDVMTYLRAHAEYEIVAITAQQIPYIDQRMFPRQLAGPRYQADIPIFPEAELPRLIRDHAVEWVFFSYSDLAHEDVMHRAAIVQAAGASFSLLGPTQIQLHSRCPVIAVTAARTGAGKSPLSQAIARDLQARGRRVGILRHPMPYGDLEQQAVQRFAMPADLTRHRCTIEEREEYLPYIEAGLVVFAGVDYAAILAEAERESDVILWDGGNNDVPFIAPDFWITVVDALRPGHELRYYPGETNLRCAHLVVINKVADASPAAVAQIRANIALVRPGVPVIESDLDIEVEREPDLAGQRALVVEDGPTLTHGGMAYGAGWIAARRAGAIIIDPRPQAIGTIAAAYASYPHIGAVLPALGYSAAQQDDLRRTVEMTSPAVIIDASPAQATTWLQRAIPVHRVAYRFLQRKGPDLFELVARALEAQPKGV